MNIVTEKFGFVQDFHTLFALFLLSHIPRQLVPQVRLVSARPPVPAHSTEPRASFHRCSGRCIVFLMTIGVALPALSPHFGCCTATDSWSSQALFFTLHYLHCYYNCCCSSPGRLFVKFVKCINSGVLAAITACVIKTGIGDDYKKLMSLYGQPASHTPLKRIILSTNFHG